MTKEEKAARKAERRKAGKGLWNEFKAFINKGNAFMLAVGVVIGGAFSAIVNAFVNMLTSLATWPVPGGLKGLVTVLPAATPTQEGVAGIGQSFAAADIVEMTIKYAASQGVTITKDSDSFMQWQNSLKGLYTLHGTTWTYNMSAIIDWGALLNAVIAFLIIAVVLFIVVKVANAAAAKKAEAEAKARERYYQKHPEERPVEPEPEAPKPTQEELLTGILAELKKQNAAK
ncbi:MAG: MscL family protein [Bacilli bacterium]|nr:MscL family protein [Bacilli bacterium]